MDYISREDAKTLLEFAVTDKWSLEYARKRFELDLPAADVIERDTATVCGYPLEYLIAIAHIAEKKEITPDMAIEQFEDFKEVSKTFINAITSVFDDTYSRLFAPEVKP
jgi:hypothetical protein